MHHGRQCRLRGSIVVPQVVMHELKAPDELPGRSTQRYDRIGIRVRAWAQAAKMVGTRATCGNEDEIALGVDGKESPRIGGP